MKPDIAYPEILKNEKFGSWFEARNSIEGQNRYFTCLAIQPEFVIVRNTPKKKILLIYPEKNLEEEYNLDNFFSFLSELENWQDTLRKRLQEDFYKVSEFPFVGGFLGYFGFGLKDEIEKLNLKNPASTFSDSILCFYPEVLLFEYSSSMYHIVSMKPSQVNALCERLEKIASEKSGSNEKRKPPKFTVKSEDLFRNYDMSLDKEKYKEAFQKIHESIFSGRIYQSCLTSRFEKSYSGNPLEDYCNLRKLYNTPFSAYFHLNGLYILSFSVESFLSLSKDTIISRPVKGTVIRRNWENDEYLKNFLSKSRKEIAENCIIVDLIRNDAGKVSEIGSVRVSKLLEIESYPTVHQLVSEITATKRVGSDFSDILRALFPGGSMTGAPKVEALHLIEEVEACSRGIYSGALGYLDVRGNVELNMVIRTAFIFENKISFHSGGGIVADSILENEWDELLGKSEFFLKYF